MIERSSGRRTQGEGLGEPPVQEVYDQGIFRLSPTGVIESWNRGAQRLTGRRAPEAVGAELTALFPTEVAERGEPARLLREAARLGVAAYEGWLARAGEDPFWAQLSLSAVEDEEAQRLEGFVAVVVDTSAARRGAAAQARLRALLEGLEEHAALALTVDGVVEDWDGAARRLLGRRADEVVGQPLSALLPREEQEAGTAGQLVREALRRGRASYEGALPRPDGPDVLASVTLTPIEDDRGHAHGLLALVHDVGARRASDDALRESEARFQQLVDSLPDYGVFMISTDGRVMSWGTGAERLKGYSAGEVIGSTLEPFFTPEDVAAGLVADLLQRAAEEGRAEFEGWLRRKGGTRFWANLILTAIRGADGRLRGFSNIARDLTERMRAERTQSFLAEVGAALAGSLDYRASLDRVARLTTRDLAQACIIAVAGAELIHPVTVAHLDPEAERTLERAASSVPRAPRIGYGVAVVVQSSQPELVPDLTRAAWAGEALGIAPEALRALDVRSYVCVPLTARGATYGAIVLLARAGQTFGAAELSLAEELARRASLAIDNARLHHQAQEAVGLREQVLTVVSHDLRSPLSTILMAAERLTAHVELPRPAVTATARRVKVAAERMSHMIRDLLDFSQIEAGQLRVDVAEQDLRPLLTETIDQLRASAAERGVELRDETADADGVRTRCDRERIAQVLTNLVTNAIKFTGEGGAVTVRARRTGDRVVLSVADTGVGIAPQDLSNVFDRYWRRDAGGRAGLGLGLAISGALVRAHGDRIEVKSAVGEGSTFSFGLPLVSVSGTS